MDGTRDRPPGKTAENWSRKDGIRAGSVSGPWRSAPRDQGTPSAGPRTLVAAGAPQHPATAPARAQSVPAAGVPVAPGPRTTGWTLGMRVWIALGLVVALAIVAAAVMFRTTMSDDAHASQVAAVPPAPAATDAAPAARVAAEAGASTDPALTGVTSVRLRIGPEFPPERRAAILAALSAAGISAVRVEPLPFEIATSRVGYYREADLSAAEALGRLISPVIATDGEVGVRDYGQLLADPEPGRLDLWVGG